MIPDLYFASCVSLEKIEMSGNNLTVINEQSFAGLVSIRELYLRNNMIEDTIGDIIWNLHTLTHLYLDGNKLTRLPSLDTDGSPKLRRFSVANNKINNITENQILLAYRIITLNISHTLITDLDFISALRSLHTIYLSNTPIPSIETLLDNVPRLTALVLSDNGLVTFPLFSASKRSLKYVDISQNKLKCVDVQHLTNMSSLWKLYLEYNNIERFPDTWCKNGNNLTTAWHHLQFPNLEQLRLDNNQLIHLQRDLLASMPKLMLLNVSFNEIETMPFLSAVGTSLMHAYLDHNKISHIEL